MLFAKPTVQFFTSIVTHFGRIALLTSGQACLSRLRLSGSQHSKQGMQITQLHSLAATRRGTRVAYSGTFPPGMVIEAPPILVLFYYATTRSHLSYCTTGGILVMDLPGRTIYEGRAPAPIRRCCGACGVLGQISLHPCEYSHRQAIRAPHVACMWPPTNKVRPTRQSSI